MTGHVGNARPKQLGAASALNKRNHGRGTPASTSPRIGARTRSGSGCTTPLKPARSGPDPKAERRDPGVHSGRGKGPLPAAPSLPLATPARPKSRMKFFLKSRHSNLLYRSSRYRLPLPCAGTLVGRDRHPSFYSVPLERQVRRLRMTSAQISPLGLLLRVWGDRHSRS